MISIPISVHSRRREEGEQSIKGGAGEIENVNLWPMSFKLSFPFKLYDCTYVFWAVPI